MNIKKVKRKVKHVFIKKRDIYDISFNFNDYHDKEIERCKKLGIYYDPFDRFGSTECWNNFYQFAVNE